MSGGATVIRKMAGVRAVSEGSVKIERRGVAAVIARDGKLLVIRRSQSVAAPGYYCFPGGGIEGVETEQQALVRELQEELGVRVRPRTRLWESVSPWHVHLAWWHAELEPASRLLPNPAEVASVHWHTPQEMAALPMLLMNNDEFLTRLMQGRLPLAFDEL